MPPDRAQYERSQIDWRRLNAYACRVARETSKPKHVRAVTQRGRRPKTTYKTMYKRRLFRSSIPYTVSYTGTEFYDETEHINTDYWVLDRRYRCETTIHQPDPNFHRLIETEYTEFCLASDGTLFKHFWEEIEMLKILGGGKAPINDHHTRPLGSRDNLSDVDVMLFDFWPKLTSHKDGNRTIETNSRFLHPGLKLRHHKKGVGLSKALGTLLK